LLLALWQPVQADPPVDFSQRQERITRRALDPSFQRLHRLTLDKTVKLYGDVLAQIEVHYVDEVKFQQLYQYGLDNLELALDNPAFLRVLFPNVPPERRDYLVARCREVIRQHRPQMGELLVTNRFRAQEEVEAIALGMEQCAGAKPTVVVLEFVCATCEALDEYSAYLTPDRFLFEYALSQSDMAGIGVRLDQVDGRILIAAVEPGSPAALKGVQPNDQVLRVDRTPVRNLTKDEVELLLLGRDGTTVTLELQGALDPAPRRVQVTRLLASVPSISDARIVDPEHGIAYIHIAFFHTSTPAELDAALARLRTQGMRALILDLRGNPGGLLDVALEVADRFIDSGVIAFRKGRSPGVTAVHEAQASEQDLTVPLVVLIDGDSASASEVIAGAIKDHRRGVLVGQRSYGKGSVQYLVRITIFQSGIAMHCGIRLTVARLYSPLDSPYGEHGVTPDILVDRPLDDSGMEPSMASVMELQRYQFKVALQTARELLPPKP
jgi:carboxyl-terminal processing protease